MDLVVSESESFVLRIAPPRLAASPTSDATQEPIAVACTVEAQLVTNDQISVKPSGWVTQQYDSTVRTWTWIVNADEAGESEAVLMLRPILRGSAGSRSVSTQPLATEEFAVTFDSTESTVKKASKVASHVWAILGALAVGISAILGAVAAIRGRSTRAPRPDE